ncbi:MAG: DUF4190 domain-containing protein [Umezawaea sp.]
MSAPVHQPEPVVRPRNGVAVAGFTLGLVGLPFSYVAVMFPAIAWPLTTLGLVLSTAGLRRANKGSAKEGLAIAGVVLSLLGLGQCLLWTMLVSAVTNYGPERRAGEERVVVYEVSGDAEEVTVIYSTWGASGQGTRGESLTSLPWRKEQTVKGWFGGGMLTVTPGPEGGTVTCQITVSGAETKTVTEGGTSGAATCVVS